MRRHTYWYKIYNDQNYMKNNEGLCARIAPWLLPWQDIESIEAHIFVPSRNWLWKMPIYPQICPMVENENGGCCMISDGNKVCPESPFSAGVMTAFGDGSTCRHDDLPAVCSATFWYGDRLHSSYREPRLMSQCLFMGWNEQLELLQEEMVLINQGKFKQLLIWVWR